MTTKYSIYSHQFFNVGTQESLGLRRSRATFANSPSIRRDSEHLQVRAETFCCAPSTSTLRQSRESLRSLSSTDSTVSSPLPQDIHIQGWMYWARRDNLSEAERYTKVYAVLRNEFLLLYRNDKRQSKEMRPQPLVQIAVASSWRSVEGVLHVDDPYGEEMELHLYERQDFDICRRWVDALEKAAELTHSHFSNFGVKVNDLSRNSVYRGTLHDFRLDRKSSIRKSVTQIKQLKSWNTFWKFIPEHISKYSRSQSTI